MSLLTLGNVISALSKRTKPTATQKGHVPYRDSKLTYLLSDSLGGNSLTLMIACVTPTATCYDESVSTLRFAERAKKVTNRARVNLDATSLRILELEAEIAMLKKLLANCTCGSGKSSSMIKNLKLVIGSWMNPKTNGSWNCCGRVGSADTIVTTEPNAFPKTPKLQKFTSKRAKQIGPLASLPPYTPKT